MDNIRSQLETLYGEGNYRERLLDIENKRREYYKKKLLFDVMRLIMAAAYIVLELSEIAAIWFLPSKEKVFVAVLAIAIIGAGTYTIWRGWREAKRRIGLLLEVCMLMAIKFPIEAVKSLQGMLSSNDHKQGLRFFMALFCVMVGVNAISFIGLLIENIFGAILVAIVAGSGMYGILTAWRVLESRINSLFRIYGSALLNFRSEALTSFTQIIYPNAKEVKLINAWEFESSSKDSLGVVGSELFYSELERYGERNKLTFSINGLTYDVGEVEVIFVINSRNEATEFDRFVYFDKKNSPIFGIFRGTFYSLPFLKAKQASTYLIPKKGTPIPLTNREKIVTNGAGKPRYVTVQVSEDYPWLEHFGQANAKSPDRFKRRGFEEYSMESDALEDRFYTFGNDENATRKLLSYRFMERIVEVVTPKQNEGSSESKGGIFSFFKKKDTWGCNLWLVMQGQRLSIARQRHDLMFFTQTGEQSAEFENVLENFGKLQSILQTIDELDVFQANT